MIPGKFYLYLSVILLIAALLSGYEYIGQVEAGYRLSYKSLLRTIACGLLAMSFFIRYWWTPERRKSKRRKIFEKFEKAKRREEPESPDRML